MILERNLTYNFSEKPSEENIEYLENAINAIMLNEIGFEPTSDTQDMVDDIITTIEEQIIAEDGDNAYVDFDLGINVFDLSVDIYQDKIVFSKFF